ncbi:unnamed protein product, partial [Didymodactylos carnosus]
MEWSSSYHKHSYSDLIGTIRELSDIHAIEHNHQIVQSLNKEPLYEEFRLVNTGMLLKSPSSLSKKGQKLKRDIQLNTSLPMITTVLSTTTTVMNISSLYTSKPELVQYTNLSLTTSYDESSLINSDDKEERWANLIDMHNEELIPIDIMSRQMLFDASVTVDGSGESTLLPTPETISRISSTYFVETSTLPQQLTMSSTMESTIRPSSETYLEPSTIKSESTNSEYIVTSLRESSTLIENETLSSVNEFPVSVEMIMTPLFDSSEPTLTFVEEIQSTFTTVQSLTESETTSSFTIFTSQTMSNSVLSTATNLVQSSSQFTGSGNEELSSTQTTTLFKTISLPLSSITI